MREKHPKYNYQPLRARMYQRKRLSLGPFGIYDALSRLSTAPTTGSATYPQWGLSWGYDRYGNRLNQTITAGTAYQGSLTVNAATNRITTAG